MRTCPECQGNGNYLGTVAALVCPRCSGEGDIPERQTCYACKGDGWIEKAPGIKLFCEWCQGTGTFGLEDKALPYDAQSEHEYHCAVGIHDQDDADSCTCGAYNWAVAND